MSTIEDVVELWFGAPASDAAALGQKMKRWYTGGAEEDARLTARFGPDVERALSGALDGWAETPAGRIALILLLDQMTRSIFRGQARAFAGDPAAQRLAVEALDAGIEASLSFEHRQFLLMPLLHAEDTALLDRFIVEVQRHIDAAPEWARPILGAGREQGSKYRAVVGRFGRFPHRNEALGRASTPEEIEFLTGWAAQAKPAIMAELAKR